MARIIVCPSCGVKNRVRDGMRGVPLCGKCKKPLAPPEGDIRVLAAESFDSAIRLNPRPVLVDFWAAWCQPCRRMAVELKKFAAAWPGITIAKVDIDAEPGLASQYQIFGVPTLVMFVKGSEAHRVSGLMSAAELAVEFRPWLQPEAKG